MPVICRPSARLLLSVLLLSHLPVIREGECSVKLDLLPNIKSMTWSMEHPAWKYELTWQERRATLIDTGLSMHSTVTELLLTLQTQYSSEYLTQAHFYRTLAANGAMYFLMRPYTFAGESVITKSLFVKCALCFVVLTGLLRSLLKHRWRYRVESVLENSNLALLWKKPPDPDPPKAITHVKKSSRRNRCSTLNAMARLLTATTLLPAVLGSADFHLREDLRGCMAKGRGVLDSSRLSPAQAKQIRRHLKELPTGLLGHAGPTTLESICDSGASVISTPQRADFVTYNECPKQQVLTGIAGGLKIEGRGVIRYEMIDRTGGLRVVERNAVLIPDLPVRLIPPQCIFNEEYMGHCRISGSKCSLNFSNGQVVDCDFDPSSNLPMIRVFLNAHKEAETTLKALYSCVSEENNQNLRPVQRSFLRWHFRLGHTSPRVIKWLASSGILGDQAKSLGTLDDLPKCGTCQYAKQGRRPTGATTTTPKEGKEGGLKTNITEPGQGTATDQFEVVKKGRLFSSRGREQLSERYCGGTIFVDIATGLTRCYFQHSLNADETIRSKLKYEREAAEAGVHVQSYHADNGIYTSAKFTEEIHKRGQKLTFCGVGAHHGNGIAERGIRTTVTSARVMLLHAMLRWPDTTTPDLWPMAMKHAEYLSNRLPRLSNGWSSVEMFLRTTLDPSDFQQLPVWGCPLYCLSPTLQDGRKLPKWQPRSRRGQYMGRSPQHASTVHLARNLNTGYISPQYHLVFDNWFETVHASDDETPPEWEFLVNHCRYRAAIDDDDWAAVELNDEWLSRDDLLAKRARINQREREKRARARQQQPVKEPKQAPHARPSAREPSFQRKDPSLKQREPSPVKQREPSPIKQREERSQQREPSPAKQREHAGHAPQDFSTNSQDLADDDPSGDDADDDPPEAFDEHSVRRSTRQRTGVSRLTYDTLGTPTTEGVRAYFALQDAMTDLMTDAHLCGNTTFQASYLSLLFSDPETGAPDFSHCPEAYNFAMKAKAKKDPDLPSYNEAMQGPYRDNFLKEMKTEIENLRAHGTWKLVRRSSLPLGTEVLPSTWAFRIKRLPDQSINKFKSRFCARGDKQTANVNVFDTYAPVVRWSTIRCVLSFALQQGLLTRQVDFSNAFVHASLPDHQHVFLEPPREPGFYEDRDVVFKLSKSLYGLRDSPYHFFNHLSQILAKMGYKSSPTDPCMFTHPNGMIILSYVDDVLLFHKDKGVIDSTIAELRKDLIVTEEKYKEEAERDVYSYLGIEVEVQHSSNDEDKSPPGSSASTDPPVPTKIVLCQTSLIRKILKATHMEDCKPRSTPASERPLGLDKTGDPFSEDWDYGSVVGMLMYLVNTRCDIQFAVHQAARFTHAPKHSHGEAVKRICRYLQGTTTKGLEFAPVTSFTDLRLDCYVDADFLGLYNVEDPLDPVSSRSRTGYIMKLGACPVTWSSRLQSETALSSVESEYIALSTAMRELIPLRRLVAEIATTLRVPMQNSRVISKVFEDNTGCISVAKAPQLSARTRHICAKYHFFKSHIGADKGIEIEYISTTEQQADAFTKGLAEPLFTKLRKLFMGW